MALLILSSENEDFSYVISKNPSNSLIVQDLRKGYVCGWFSTHTPNTYCALFIDSQSEMSFSKKDFSYLDTSALVSAVAYLSMMNEVLRSAWKGHAKDIATKSSIEIRTLKLPSRTISLIRLVNNQLDLEIVPIEVSPGVYSLTVSGVTTIQHLLGVTSLLLLLSTTKDDMSFTKDVVSKYIRILESMKSPYYLVRRIANILIHDKNTFSKYKERLEGACREVVNLTFGDSLVSRKDYVASFIKERATNVVDLGAGEGNYLFLAKLIGKYIYYPIDIDPSLVYKLSVKTETIDNAALPLSSFSEWVDLEVTEDTTLVLTEVLEHMNLEESLDLLVSIAKVDAIKRIVITIPNKAFNVYYSLEGFRHEDHKWEANSSIVEVLTEPFRSGWEIVVEGVGDIVGSEYPSYGIKLVRKENDN